MQEVEEICLSVYGFTRLRVVYIVYGLMSLLVYALFSLRSQFATIDILASTLNCAKLSTNDASRVVSYSQRNQHITTRGASSPTQTLNTQQKYIFPLLCPT